MPSHIMQPLHVTVHTARCDPPRIALDLRLSPETRAAAAMLLPQSLPFKDVMVEFPVSRDALLPVGTQITAAHFVAGQHMDVTGWSKWKGFQGADGC